MLHLELDAPMPTTTQHNDNLHDADNDESDEEEQSNTVDDTDLSLLAATATDDEQVEWIDLTEVDDQRSTPVTDDEHSITANPPRLRLLPPLTLPPSSPPAPLSTSSSFRSIAADVRARRPCEKHGDCCPADSPHHHPPLLTTKVLYPTSSSNCHFTSPYTLSPRVSSSDKENHTPSTPHRTSSTLHLSPSSAFSVVRSPSSHLPSPFSVHSPSKRRKVGHQHASPPASLGGSFLTMEAEGGRRRMPR